MIYSFLLQNQRIVILQMIMYYAVVRNLENVLSNLRWTLKSVLKWFGINSLEANPGKFQFMVLGTGQINSYNLFIDV